MTARRSMHCPKCNHEIPVHQGFPSWCDQCEWNLLPHAVTPPKTALERVKAQLDQRSSQQLFEALKNQAELRAGWTLNRALTVGLALLVHASTLGLLLLGGWAVYSWLTGTLFFILGLGGVFLVLLAVTVAPRIASFPDDGLVSAQDAPRLHQLINRIAQELGFHKSVTLVLDGEYNASFSYRGWRWRCVLTLGLPLFWVLEPQEKVALLAHELAHGVNGDSTRGFIVWSAVNTISRWQSLFDPDVDFGEEGFVAVLRYVFYPLM